MPDWMESLARGYTAMGAARPSWVCSLRGGLSPSWPLCYLALQACCGCQLTLGLRTGNVARGLCSEWGVGQGSLPPKRTLAAVQRLPGDPPGPAAHFVPLCPLVCYISALVLSCSLTFFVLIRSLVTHRLVADSDPQCKCGEEVTVSWAYRTPDPEESVGKALGLEGGRSSAGPAVPEPSCPAASEAKPRDLSSQGWPHLGWQSGPPSLCLPGTLPLVWWLSCRSLSIFSDVSHFPDLVQDLPSA